MNAKLAKVAVAIPCLNEEATIALVVNSFKKELPQAEIYVFDNNSTDQSVECAKEAGAQIHHVYKQGKGNVMRAIFDKITADFLIVVDGDNTYAAEDVHKLLVPVEEGFADMAVGNRLNCRDKEALYTLNRFGNILIVNAINSAFGSRYQDILSGYRVLSRRFVQRIPLLTPRFETETEITLQALEEGLNVVELPVSYHARPQNSQTKLRPFRDGWHIMMAAAMLLRDHQPLRFYGILGGTCLGVAFCAALLKITNLYQITFISDSLLAGLILLFLPVGTILILGGLILSAINTKFKELKQLNYRNQNSNGNVKH